MMLGREAYLAFCEGLDRITADATALGEHGYTSWQELALGHAE